MDGKLKKAGCLFSTGFFKKVLIMMFVLNVCIGKLAAVYGNNVRISGEPDVQLNATSDSLSLTFILSWDNSWRDNFNWDAVWLFVKYKKEGSTDAWSHLYLGGAQIGTSVLDIDPGNTGNQIVGAFVYPKNKGAFNITGERVTLRAPLNGLSASDITDKKVYFAVSAIEMVLIPYGAYYLGDGVSNHTFKSYNISLIPPEADIIGTSSEFNYTCDPKNYGTAYASNAADRKSYSSWNETYTCHIARHTHGDAACINNSWTVDFGSAKAILTFGVSIPNFSDQFSNYFPAEDWFLLGSGDGFAWDTLQRCKPFWVTKDASSYPIRRAIRVSSPGAYRYYRLFFPNMGNNGFMLNNVAMSERDLYPNSMNEYKYIDSEDAIIFGNSVVDGLYADDGQTWSGTLPATYPKGYKGFYIMKYELSQEQYCNFLNMLSYTQQKNRIGNALDKLNRGDYVFGSPKQPSCRNGIAVFSRKNTSQPAVFGCNLNPAEPFFSEDDGQTLACNYMTGADMLAYLDWSGLRPMSELEYEKACRTPNRVIPGEYAWNTASIASLGGQAGLAGATMGTEDESPVNVNTNANSGTPSFGPVRCGSFGTSSTNQEQSGGSFYGVMELSGNLGEMCYSVTGGSPLNTTSSNNEYHGDGVLAADGNYNVSTYWNRSNDVMALSIRGGSFASPNSLLRVSDRSVTMAYNNTLRDSSVTFRGVRSIEESVIPGEIEMLSDIVCPGFVDILNKDKAVCATDFKYQWYVKRPGELDYEVIKNEEGESLNDYEVVNITASPQVYCFKRKVLSLTGESFSNIVNLTVASVPTDIPSVPPSYNSIVGTQFNLPCIEEGQNKSEWKTPGGNILPCNAAQVTTSASSEIYQVYFVDEHGCKGETRDVVVKGFTGLSSIPKHAKVYQGLGATLDGVYMIDPDGPGGNEPLPVYSSMTHEGGGWMLIVNSLSNTSVPSLTTSGVYNASYLGDIYVAHKFADSWINLIDFDMYWTEGRDGCNKISNSYWKASECRGGGKFVIANSYGEYATAYSCYKRYGDPAMTTGFHEGEIGRFMFDDLRGYNAYFIWPYRTGAVYVLAGYPCVHGAGTGEYRIWVR